jgi:hypothetical protein
VSSTLKKGYNEYIIKYNYTMFIYLTTNNITNQQYIGLKSKTVEEAILYNGSGKRLLSAIEKYGKENFTRTILERDITDWELLCKREIYWIAKYDTFENPKHYNLTKGGEGGYGVIFSDERRVQMSDARKGKVLSREWKSNISKRLKEYNSKHERTLIADETRTKMSEAKLDYYKTPGAKAKASKAAKKRCEDNPITDETRANQSVTRNKYYKDPVNIAKHSNAMKKAMNTPEAKANVAAASKGTKFIHNPITLQTKKVKVKLLVELLNNGWVIGMSPKG